MPNKDWDIQSELNEGSFVDCHSTADGKVAIDDGKSVGVWTSPVYDAVNWQWWCQMFLLGTRGRASNIYYRFRSGTTSQACAEAPWTPYMDDMDQDGRIDHSIRIYYRNNPTASVGRYIQIEVTLEAS